MSFKELLADALKARSMSWVLEQLSQAAESVAEELRARKPTSEIRKKIDRLSSAARMVGSLARRLQRRD